MAAFGTKSVYVHTPPGHWRARNCVVVGATSYRGVLFRLVERLQTSVVDLSTGQYARQRSWTGVLSFVFVSSYMYSTNGRLSSPALLLVVGATNQNKNHPDIRSRHFFPGAALTFPHLVPTPFPLLSQSVSFSQAESTSGERTTTTIGTHEHEKTKNYV